MLYHKIIEGSRFPRPRLPLESARRGGGDGRRGSNQAPPKADPYEVS
jgi:hypothetical protein